MAHAQSCAILRTSWLLSLPTYRSFGVQIVGWATHSINGRQDPELQVLRRELARADVLQNWRQVSHPRFITRWGLNLVSADS